MVARVCVVDVRVVVVFWVLCVVVVGIVGSWVLSCVDGTSSCVVCNILLDSTCVLSGGDVIYDSKSGDSV